MIASLNSGERRSVVSRAFKTTRHKSAGVFGWRFPSRFGQQRAPEDSEWIVWLILAGRGFGKTRTGAEFIHAEVKAGRARRVALIAPTAADVRSVMIEGESGLLAVHPPWERPHYEPSNHRILWPNGAVATCYSADEPQRLRGPQYDLVWVRAQDTSGNFSAYLGPGTATTNAVDASDITGHIIGAQIDTATITGANLANSIIDYSKMASGYGIAASVGSLPGPGSPLRYAGSLVLLTTNAKLYRWDSVGGAWTVATDGGDITANSIVASSLVTGIITTAYLAAGAATASKLFVGDTTNLITDQTYIDTGAGGYWTIFDNLGTVATFLSNANTTNLKAPKGAVLQCGTIPASNSATFQISTPPIPIDISPPVPGSTSKINQYRFRGSIFCAGSGNKNLFISFKFFDASGAAIAPVLFTSALLPSSYNSPSAPGVEFVLDPTPSTGNVPSSAVSVSVGFTVFGNTPSTAAGAGNWYITNPRLERMADGTLIQSGVITTDHIDVAGLNAVAITAGTITGDRMTANFIDANVYSTVHTSGQPFIEINGSSATVTGHLNGPWFRVNDGNYDRVVIGRLQDAWGLWVNDASGNNFFEQATLANGVVVTGHLAANSVTYPYGVSVAGGTATNNATWTTLWSHNADVAGTVQVVADIIFAADPANTSSNAQVQILVNGTVQADTTQLTQTIGTITAATGCSVSVAAGQTILVRAKGVCSSSNGSISSGAIAAIIAQR